MKKITITLKDFIELGGDINTIDLKQTYILLSSNEKKEILSITEHKDQNYLMELADGKKYLYNIKGMENVFTVVNSFVVLDPIHLRGDDTIINSHYNQLCSDKLTRVEILKIKYSEK